MSAPARAIRREAAGGPGGGRGGGLPHGRSNGVPGAPRGAGAIDPRAVLELLKPLTWFAPVWALGCGVVSAGAAPWRHPAEAAGLALAGLLLAGPLTCGASQAVNDWFDRGVDAINEPGRPIPSGRLPGRSGLVVAVVATALALALAAALGPAVLLLAAIGMALAWAYSAPPIRLKRDGWLGNLAVGISYEGLPWLAGDALMRDALPGAHLLLIALCYSLGAHGIMTLNDFKSVRGDRATGLRSLPARLGSRRACAVACATMALAQVAVVVLLLAWGATVQAGLVALGLAAQLALMPRLLADPRGRAPWYNASGTSLYVLGMLAAATSL